MHSFDDFVTLRYEEIDSTNTEARRLIDAGRISGPTVLTAERQTGGRGRQGKSFYSPAGSGLYMTVILKPMCPISSAVTLTTRTACCVAQAIEYVLHIKTGIKWVNDLYFLGKKVCGILCEAVNDYERGILKYVIIGVGINLTTADFPDELTNVAGSLKVSDTGLNEVREELMRDIAVRVADLQNCDFPGYYRENSIVIGREIEYIENGAVHPAFAESIDDEGGLVVREDREGVSCVRVLTSGEISIKM